MNLATAQDNELDRGTTSVAPGMERCCALTRAVMPVESMIRFVVSPTDEVVPDVKRKLPGRGLWITGTRDAVTQAAQRNVFARGFKRNVRVAADLATATERLIERATLDALAIAGKAGLVAAGFAKVEAALGDDEIVALIHAADAADDGRRKLDAAWQRKTAEKQREIAIVDLFSGAQLDLALNRPNVIHAALLAGPGATTFLARVARLQRFRTPNSPAPAPTVGARGLNDETSDLTE
ncbi:MAG: RNA-binding protein [Stellaceae bacterium]